MDTRLFLKSAMFLAVLSVAFCVIPSASDALQTKPKSPPTSGPNPGPIGTGTGTCVAQGIVGEICELEIYGGSRCIINSSGGLQCQIPPIQSSPPPPPSKCFQLTGPSGTQYLLCDVIIMSSGPRCAVTGTGQIQCDQWPGAKSQKAHGP